METTQDRPTMDPRQVQEYAQRYAITDPTGDTALFVAYMVAADPHGKNVQWPSFFKFKEYSNFNTKLQDLRQYAMDTIIKRSQDIFRAYEIDGAPGVPIPQKAKKETAPEVLKAMDEVFSIVTLSETKPEDLVSICGSMAAAAKQLQDEMRDKAVSMGLPAELGPTVGGSLWVPSAPQEWQVTAFNQ